MKQFARSLVSVVIALSILATMCIVGISASAKVHEFVFVSDTAKKDVADMSNTWATDTNDYAVVNSADLGTLPEGAPATAYRVNAKPNTNPGQTRPGYKALINGYSTDFSTFKDKAANITVDMWIYVSDVTAVGNLILCLYDDANYGVNYGTVNNNGHVSFTEYNFASYGSLQTKMQNGWNHLQFAAGSFNATRLSGKVVGYSIHEHAGAKGNYTVAVGSLKLVYDDKNAENGVDKNKVGTTVISATAQKDSHDVGHAVHSGSRKTGEVSVVKTSTLTGGDEGVPSADAYMIRNASLKEGIVTAVDIPAATANTSGAYLNVWIYIKDASTMNNLVFRFYATGKRVNGIDNSACATTQEQAGNKTVVLKNGWNNLVYNWTTTNNNLVEMTVHDHKNNASNGGKDNGTTDTAVYNDIAVACARIITNKEDATMPWDGSDPVVYPTDKEYLVYGIKGEEGITGTYGDETYDGGTGAFATVVPAGKSYHAFMKNMTTPVDLTGKTVTAWVYVTDITKYDGQLEITSGGGADNGEHNWAVADLGLKNGWNKVVLDPNNKKGTAGVVSGAIGYSGVTDGSGAYDTTKVNFFRIYDTGDLAGVKVGAVYVTPDEKDEEKVDPNREYVDFAPEDKAVEDMHSTMGGEKFEVVKVSTLKKGAAYKGKKTTAYLVDNSGATNAERKAGVYFTLETPVKMAAKGNEKDYTLDMWYYYEGTASENILQLYSNNHESNKEGFANTVEYWTYRYILKNLTQGWNHIVLTLDQFSMGADNDYNKKGAADWEANQTITGVSFHENTAANYGKYTYAIADLVVAKTSELVKTGDAVNLAVVVVAILMAAMAASVTVYFGKKSR